MNYTMTVEELKAYHFHLEGLFQMLVDANRADGDYALPWQRPSDAAQTGYYGAIYDAIKEIAGLGILEHFGETGELETSLADRNKWAQGA